MTRLCDKCRRCHNEDSPCPKKPTVAELQKGARKDLKELLKALEQGKRAAKCTKLRF